MTLQDIVKAAQQLSLQEQIRLVSQLAQTLEQAFKAGVATTPSQIPAKQQSIYTTPKTHSLKGKVRYYDAPYETVAFEDNALTS